MRKLILPLLILLSVWNNRCIAQQPGDLDNSFGTGGKVVMQYAPWTDVAIQPDGKALAAGTLLARYKIDGTLDSTFGINGIDTIRIDSVFHLICSAVEIQSDGKILVVAVPFYGNMNLNDFLLIRYNADGSVDSSFNGNGFVLTDISSGSEDDATGLAIQTDGKIIVGGASDQSPALVRYNSNGSLDNTFNYDGKLVLNNINGVIISNWGSVAYMKVQVNGKILTGSSSGMVRLNPDGSVDNSFGNNGLKFLPAPMNDVAIQPDGKIVLAGGTSNFVIVRLDSNGAPDSSFANSGVETVYPYYVGCGTQAHQATSVVLQPDGRIIAAGYHWCCAMNDCRDFVLMRFNENGGLDSSFGQGGQEKTLMGFSSESHASAITPDLKLVLAGFAYDFDYGGLARYHLGTMLDVKNPPLASGDVIIAPNPTKDRITIKASAIENGTWQVEILDQAGRSLLRETVTVNKHSLQKEISLHRFEDGIYFLKMTGATRTMTYKVVKSE